MVVAYKNKLKNMGELEPPKPTRGCYSLFFYIYNYHIIETILFKL